ncbi:MULTISPECIES: MauE/DoxX family redox-associated membrane protein [unclassified Streptomyces]|uniref:MauE/DoxX family redox-associated membrane protein n=1 Tax=unclassified Streptomyces TaxID=2593676 RepID=UPI0033E559DD
MPYLIFGCRALLFGVFLVAAAGKLRGRAAFDEFAASIVDLRLLPRKLSGAAASAVAAVELAVVALLVIPATIQAGLLLGTGLLLVLTTGILASLRMGRRTPCRCFGTSATPLGPVHVTRNLILAAIGGVGIIAAFGNEPDSWPPHPGGSTIALITALVGVLLVVRLDDLVSLFSNPSISSAIDVHAEKK